MRVSTSNVARLQQATLLAATALEHNNARHHPRYMDDVCPNFEREIRLQTILEEENPLDCVYAYWVVDGKKITPAIVANHGAHRDFLEDLRDEFGAYEYEIMIRRRRTMICSCRISFAEPLNFYPRKDIRAEITRLRKEKRK